MAWRLFGAKPLPEPMLSYCQLDPWEQLQWNLNQNKKFFIHTLENVVSENGTRFFQVAKSYLNANELLKFICTIGGLKLKPFRCAALGVFLLYRGMESDISICNANCDPAQIEFSYGFVHIPVALPHKGRGKVVPLKI